MKKLMIILFFAAFNHSYAQSYQRYIRKAEKATGRVDYTEAIKYYDKALAIDNDAYEANAGKGIVLGEFMERYEQAVPYLEKAVSKGTKDTLLTIYYTLGKCYHYLGDYNKALYCYNKLLNYEEVGNDMFPYYLRKHIADCQYGLQHTARNDKQVVKNVGPDINSADPEYAPVFAKNELIFTSKRKDDKKEKINTWDGKYFESMYVSKMENGKFSAPRRFTFPDLDGHSKFSKYNESSVSISLDGSSLFIYRAGDIFIVPANDRTKKPEKLSKAINMARYQNHATITKDNSTIYFSSESKEGFGGTDIFKSVKNAQGEWSEAELLDSTINTMFNEDAPFISEDGTLYFSSNGHPGYGGYDIYKTRFENGHWSKPENLGQPVNSPGQDIFLSLVNNTEGYYSSARTGGYGDLDIYTVDLNPQIKNDTVSDPLLALKHPEQKKENVKSPLPDSTNQYLTNEALEKIGWNYTALYFNYNEFTLRKDAFAALDHNIEIMKKNKKIMIGIAGYSDARGPEKYNAHLSANRAQTVKQYILSKGIERNRIKSTEGLGESNLLNNCGDNAECDEAQHQLNRRVELRVFNENYRPKNEVVGQK